MHILLCFYLSSGAYDCLRGGAIEEKHINLFNLHLTLSCNVRSAAILIKLLVFISSTTVITRSFVHHHSVGPELQSRVNNRCIAFVQSLLSLVVIDSQSRTDSA